MQDCCSLETSVGSGKDISDKAASKTAALDLRQIFCRNRRRLIPSQQGGIEDSVIGFTLEFPGSSLIFSDPVFLTRALLHVSWH